MADVPSLSFSALIHSVPRTGRFGGRGGAATDDASLSSARSSVLRTGRDGEKWLGIDAKKHAAFLTTASNDYLYTLANDPSVAQHLVERNVRRGVPAMVERGDSFRRLTADAAGVKGDLVDAIRSLDNMCDIPVFQSVQSKLQLATEFAKQLLDEDPIVAAVSASSGTGGSATR